ncbi:DEAD/DEAH box helicase [Candidatus Bathyarchaeota archaeon]|nr:DEAD/DEAH box helicase [Candidatus Bathyarchaeota archaeon]
MQKVLMVMENNHIPGENRLKAILKKKKQSDKAKVSLLHERALPAKESKFLEINMDRLHPKLSSYLESVGFNFWTHQSDAIENILDGRNVVISTSTASGKTMCYLIPILNSILESGLVNTTFLVYPLKALAQDQFQKIRRIFAALDIPQRYIGVYDADTAIDDKRRIRNECKIVITNPYGLHMYLGNHRLWKKFLEHVHYIVFDEVHVYTGVFGSNVALLMRRIKRIANAYGKNPQWIFCSATIGNPRELAEKLTGLPFILVDDDGSNTSEKYFWLWNPAYNKETDQRISYHHDSRELFQYFIQHGLQTLMFTQSRKMAELQAKWAINYFRGTRHEGRIMPYRAGYPARTRRKLEKQLRERSLIGISATSALELGIDIGSLDAVIISGFPGSMMSLWQQAGRCGRGKGKSIVVFCAGSDALDQYYINHPQMFFKKNHESAIISLENPYILRGHLACAVKERPIGDSELLFFGPRAHPVMRDMLAEGIIHRIGNKFFYAKDDFPAEKIPLNAIPTESYQVFQVDRQRRRYLTSETEDRVFSTLHEGAIFLFMAETFKVISLDLDEKVVSLKREEVNYYTEPYYDTSVIPLVERDNGEKVPARRRSSLVPALVRERGEGLEPLEIHYGNVTVEKRYTKYVEKKISDGSTMSQHPLHLPRTKFNTKGVFIIIPNDIHVALLEQGSKKLGGGIHAIEHGIIALFPQHVFCSRWDVGGVSITLDPLFNRPVIYLYDSFPGGIGLVEKAKDVMLSLLGDTLEIIKSCTCQADTGCPSCVQSPKCGNGNDPISKSSAETIIEMLLQLEYTSPRYFKPRPSGHR